MISQSTEKPIHASTTGIRIAFLLLLMAAPMMVLAQQQTKPGKRPNIIVIISDDHAYQAIGAYGAKFGVTPNIDRLATRGAIFTDATVVNSLCGPSRAALLTARFSHKNGFKDNHSSFDGSQDNFTKQLRSQGYQTAWIGKWHLETKPQGFDYWTVLPGQGNYYNPDFLTMDGGQRRYEGYCTDITTDLSEQWLNGLDPNRPFCLVIGQKAPHRTWMPDTTDLGKLDHVQFPLPDNFYDTYEGREAAARQDMSIEKTMRLGYDLKMVPDTGSGRDMYNRMTPAQRKRYIDYYEPIRKDLEARKLSGNALTEWKYQRYMKDYLTTTMSLDRNVGRIMDYLDKHNLSENTIIVYTSDQGFYLGEHGWFDKRFMYEESLRTPLIMSYPGVIKPGSTISTPVMNIDLGPTFLTAAGVKVPSDMQGLPMQPVLKGKGKLNRECVYYHYYEFGEHSVRPHFGIRSERYKIIRFYGDINAWEFFDLEKDPGEMHNLYGKPEHEALVKKYQQKLLQESKKYEDDEALKLLAADGIQ